jgi:hypothetical protein
VFLETFGFTSGALDGADRIVVFGIRFPRAVLGILIGAALAVSGAVMQGVFRNPLADPGIVGVSAGAGLGAVSFIVLQGGALAPVAAVFGIYSIPFAAFLGGLVSTLLLYRISTRQGRTSVATMLLAGIALGALAGGLHRPACLLGGRPAIARFDVLGAGFARGSDLDKEPDGGATDPARDRGTAADGAGFERAGARRSLGAPSRRRRAALQEHRDPVRRRSDRSVGCRFRRHRLCRHQSFRISCGC